MGGMSQLALPHLATQLLAAPLDLFPWPERGYLPRLYPKGPYSPQDDGDRMEEEQVRNQSTYYFS